MSTITSTPYDDVFKTLLNDCTKLIIPVINEIFGEHYTGNEPISDSRNEHFLHILVRQFSILDIISTHLII